MSHVVSSQPSSTSPYQPTATQDLGKGATTHNTLTLGDPEGSVSNSDCCFHADKSQGCCIYSLCTILSSCCKAIRDCTDKCCSSCADCLNDCCEDKPDDRRRKIYNYNERNNSSCGYSDDRTWAVAVVPLAERRDSVGDTAGNISSDHHVSGNQNWHTSGGHNSGHNSDGHKSSDHDTGHHSTGHSTVCHSTNDHSGGHDTGHSSVCHSTNDYSGGGCDSGGGGDSGGGCDSGGGGGDD